MISGDNLRWLGTVVIAGLLALLAVYFTGELALNNRAIPDALTGVDLAAIAAFFTSLGTMIGARSSQNGAAQGAAAASGSQVPATPAGTTTTVTAPPAPTGGQNAF